MKSEKCTFRIVGEFDEMSVMDSQEVFDGRGRTIATPNPHHFRWVAE
ncbi:MAG: hypothetical protein OJF52_003426 [Nitrospira sp.]|nr:MAG: hypothetical protein OJF52_003426 [Nitrospira sp.]